MTARYTEHEMFCDYKSKLLYRQHTMSEEGHDVDASVHALTWRHPSSMGSITTRTRLTIVTNFIDDSVPNVFAANIELWRDTGWIMLEEYFDDALLECYNARDAEKKCLKILESFFVGTIDEDPGPSTPNPGKAPNSSVRMKRTHKKQKPVVQEKAKKESLPKSEDDSSFDWI